MKNTLVNLTPHPICIQVADTRLEVPPSGQVARVAMQTRDCGSLRGAAGLPESPPVPVQENVYGEVEGVPEAKPFTIYLVSLLVRQRLGDSRPDCLAPATGPHDGAIRDGKGQVVAVTRLVLRA